MRMLLLAGALIGASAFPAAQANAEEMTLDEKRLINLGTMKVAVGACKLTLTAEQTAKLDAAWDAASKAPRSFSDAEFKEAMVAFGTKFGENREQNCAALTPDVIASTLADSIAGK